MSPTNTARYKYTPDEMGENEFLHRFVVRQEVFDEIFEELKEADYTVPNQHCILIGQRGQGKTTLLRKLKLEVEKDKKLSKFLIPVKFSEEQYRVRQLCRLWEEVAGYLQAYHEDIFENILDEMEPYMEDDNYHIKCFSYLEKNIKKSKKKLLLLIDNIDVLLGKFKPEEQRRLREILLTSSSFIIVGGSTKMFEQQYDYSKPFYEFFKVIRLEALSFDESIALLKVLGNKEQTAKINNIIENTPERIEALRVMTGGVPRTIVMLFDIFIEENDNAFDDLMRVLDEVTPLYKDRMDDLPPVLQDIVDAIALNWDGMFTKEIAKKTRLESKVVSAQLKQLEKYQIVDSQSIGKNKIYILKERFFNIWYLMRYGRKKDRNRVEWLIQFLLSWYDQYELESKAIKFVNTMQKSSLNAPYVYHMGEALSYTGCLSIETDYRLKKGMKLCLADGNAQYVNEISMSDKELLERAGRFYGNGEWDEALKVLLNSKRDSSAILSAIAELFDQKKEYIKAEEYYLKVIDSGDLSILLNIGNLYSEQKEYVKAEECYLKAIESANVDALSNLGRLYYKQKEYTKAERCCLKAVKSGDIRALRHLGIVYQKQKKHTKAEEYYLKAIESGEMIALNNLGNLYADQKEYIKAERYYLKAIKNGGLDASSNLSLLYFNDVQKMKNAQKIIQKNYFFQKFYINTFMYALIFLWAEDFPVSYEKFVEWLEYEGALEEESFIVTYLNLLMAKGQLYKAKVFFELPEYQLKERYKPLWYALMTLMQDEFPTEIKKMGSELKETVSEIVDEIAKMKEKYKLD